MSRKDQEERRERQREEILKAACELFAQKGFEQTSVWEIAKRVGQSDVQVLRLFDMKKNNILLEIFKRNWGYVNKLFYAAASNPKRNARQKLTALFQQVIERMLLAEPFAMVFAMEARKRGELAVELFRTGAVDFVQLVDRIIYEGQREGLFLPNLNVQAVRQMLIGCAETIVLGLLWKAKAPYLFNYTVDDAARAFESVLEGISIKKFQADTEMERV